MHEFPNEGYLDAARLSVFNIHFWFGGARPPAFPLLIKLSGGNEDVLQVVLTLLAVVSWGWLTWALQPRWRIWTFIVPVLAFAPQVKGWNDSVLSESMSFSLMILIGAAILTGHRAVALAACVLFIFSRDANAPMAFVAACVFWRKGWKRPAAVVAGLLIISGVSVDLSQRWRYSMVNVLSTRMLVSPERTEWFVSRGMPDNPKVTRFRGRYADQYGQDWSGFEPWLETSARRTMARFWLGHPLEALVQPLRDPETFDGTIEGYFGFPSIGSAWPTRGGLKALCIAAIVGLAFALARRQPIPAGVYVVVVAAGWACLLWHADAQEVGRHCFAAAILVRLGLVDMALVPWLSFLASRRPLAVATS